MAGIIPDHPNARSRTVLKILYLGWLNLFHNGTIMHMTPREQVIDMYKTFRALEQ